MINGLKRGRSCNWLVVPPSWKGGYCSPSAAEGCLKWCRLAITESFFPFYWFAQDIHIRGDYSSFSHLLVCLIRLEVFGGSAACLRTQCAARQGNPFNIVSNSKEGCLKPTFIVFTNVAKIWTNGMFSTTRVCFITEELKWGKSPQQMHLYEKKQETLTILFQFPKASGCHSW